MSYKMLGIDLAKNIFQVHGIDEADKKVLAKAMSRKKLTEFVANLQPCTIAMEACASSHYWGRKFQSMGHIVKMIYL